MALSFFFSFLERPLPLLSRRCGVLRPSNAQLVDMRWKVCVTTASRNAGNLARCYVAVDLHVADPSAKVAVHSFEMSLPKFKVRCAGRDDCVCYLRCGLCTEIRGAPLRGAWAAA
jgi:hypothetical protein